MLSLSIRLNSGWRLDCMNIKGTVVATDIGLLLRSTFSAKRISLFEQYDFLPPMTLYLVVGVQSSGRFPSAVKFILDNDTKRMFIIRSTYGTPKHKFPVLRSKQ